MYNELFKIGPVTIYGYGLMTAIGIIAAYLSCEYRAKKHGLDHTKVFGLVVSCCIFGYLGSKILYFLTILPQIIADPSIILRSLADGWVVFGGIIGGLLGAIWYTKRQKLDTWRFLDTGLASVALAQGFGRFGCFLAGCCDGRQTDSAFAIVFTHSAHAPNNVPLVPTQLISSALDFLLFFALVLFDRYVQHAPGESAALYLICYSVGRFILEFYRGDIERGAVGVLSTSQFISIFTAIAGIIIWIIRSRKRTKNGTVGSEC
ncbi:MAG: prolipoprotein diacylglyceryl transferase [Eubacterium sp.]|nr:prolipoprotein diacylglyceryl transferase [Eubacterium sp.]